MDYVIKQLRDDDTLLLKSLLGVFGDAFGEPETYLGNIPSDAYLKSLLAKPHFVVLVAMDGERVVGGLAAYNLEKFEQERGEMYIYDLAVAESHRRRGVATALIEVLKPIAKARGVYVIFVQADPEDMPAIRLYESVGGIREDVHHFDIDPGQ